MLCKLPEGTTLRTYLHGLFLNKGVYLSIYLRWQCPKATLHELRVFIRHWRTGNYPATTQNSAAKFRLFLERTLPFHNNPPVTLLYSPATPIGPLQLTVTWCKSRHAEVQEVHWDKTNKELTSFKMVIFFVCFVPVCLLHLNLAVFVPCDCKLQKAYS